MGGCRCTYRNCTVRSDGKTHLFHYPVFDKVRCNQWLTNAQRYDFLHLKVSQLKNRCVCQHHFTDDSFMNSMKEKLKLEAVPTIDGPYCNSEAFEAPEIPLNTLGLYPIPCEDIENDEYINDRKANYNKKYADFLTNCEIIEPLKDIATKDFDIEENKKNKLDVRLDVNSHGKRLVNILRKDKVPKKKHDRNVSQQGQGKPSIISNEIKSVPVPVAIGGNDSVKSNVPIRQGRSRSKINIISEKKITEPEQRIPVPLSSSSFKLVSPSMVLNINKKKKEDFKEMEVIDAAKNSEKESTITEILSVNDPSKFEIKVDIEELPSIISTPHNSKTGEEVTLSNSTPLNCEPERARLSNFKGIKQKVIDMVNFNDICHENKKVDDQEWLSLAHKNTPEMLTIEVPIKSKLDDQEWISLAHKNTPRMRAIKVPIKSKVSPQRLAAINEKRKFNMKLRDIIGAGLNQLDTPEPAPQNEIKCPRIRQLESKKETVASSLSKKSLLPDHSDYIISYLEDRMRKMENLLLNKIDQNTQKIMELKSTLETPQLVLDELSPKMPTRRKKKHDEVHKKKLFREISKYLTPDASSLVYEELFINNLKPNVLKPNTAHEPPLKRKRR